MTIDQRIDHGHERIGIDVVFLANLTDALVAKSERDTEACDHEQQVVILADQVAQFGIRRIVVVYGMGCHSWNFVNYLQRYCESRQLTIPICRYTDTL